MEPQTFEFSSKNGVEYELHVTENGFYLIDKKTGELLVDASTLILDRKNSLGFWAVECKLSPTNREWYITHVPTADDNSITFGMSRREE